MRILLIFVAAYSLLLQPAFAQSSPIGAACFSLSSYLPFDCRSRLDLKCLCLQPKFIATVTKCIRMHSNGTNASNWIEQLKPVKATCLARGIHIEPFLAVDFTDTSIPTIPQHRLAAEIAYKSSRQKNSKFSINAGGGLVGFFAAIVVFKILVNCVQSISYRFFFVGRRMNRQLPLTLKKWIFYPSLFNGRHVTPFTIGRYTLMIPTRFETIVMICFTITCVVLMIIKYPQIGITHVIRYAGIRSGFFIFSLIPLVVLFGGRNNFLSMITGWSTADFNIFHKWVGRLIIILAIAHSALLCISLFERDSFNNDINSVWLVMGFTGLTCAITLLFHSVHFLRRVHYETFYLLHIAVATVFLVSSYFHVQNMAAKIPKYLYASYAVWLVDRVMRIAKILFSGALSSFVEATYHEEIGIIKMEVNYSKRWMPYPGAYAYIYFRGVKWWQSHPFSLYTIEDKVFIAAKVCDGITRDLALKCLSQRIFQIGFEGPYGAKHRLEKYQRHLYVAGGIGLTGIYSYVNSLSDFRSNSQHVIWIVNSLAVVTAFKSELTILTDKGVRISVFVTCTSQKGAEAASSPSSNSLIDCTNINDDLNSTIYDGLALRQKQSGWIEHHYRPNIYHLIKTEITETDKSLSIMCCGPPSLSDDTRKAVVENLRHHVDYFEESFSW